MYDEAETFLILKYGSLNAAYNNWMQMTSDEQYAVEQAQFEILMEYEYEMHTNSIKYYDT